MVVCIWFRRFIILVAMRALVIGANGMDGSLMCEFLLSKGYEVVGTYRLNQNYIENIPVEKVFLDLAEFDAIDDLLDSRQFDEVYNFAGVTFAPDAEKEIDLTAKLNYFAVLRMINYCWENDIKLFQASSSEVFGNVKNQVCNELTKRMPTTHYAKAKSHIDDYMNFLRVTQKTKFYNAISFNHEGERRGEKFVTRKITKQVAEIMRGHRKSIALGNLQSRRDWGYASDFIEAYWLMVQGEPSEYVVATGISHSVEDIVRIAFKTFDEPNYKRYIRTSTKLIRPDERDNLTGDITKIKTQLGWTPQTSFEEMITKMTLNDYALL